MDEIQYTRAGGADSYLDINDAYWLGNRYSSSNVRFVNSNGSLNSHSPSVSDGARAVIYLKSGSSALTFTGGKGTAEQPNELQ